MTDDEHLGTVMAPMKGVLRGPPTKPRVLERHPASGETVRACGRCGRPGFGYRHPNPLRPGVILWRCPRHRHPNSAIENPKAAPGGGIYR